MSALRTWLARLPAAILVAALVAACAGPSGLEPGQRAGSPATAVTFAGHRPAAGRTLAVKDLSGLKPAEVLALLGRPDLTEQEPPAEVWQYRTPDCVLNLFFYDEAGSATLIHSESWQRSLGQGPVPAHCRDDDAPLRAHLISQSDL